MTQLVSVVFMVVVDYCHGAMVHNILSLKIKFAKINDDCLKIFGLNITSIYSTFNYCMYLKISQNEKLMKEKTQTNDKYQKKYHKLKYLHIR